MSIRAHHGLLLADAAAGGTWTPASLASPPALWLDDASSVTDAGSGNCSQWNDRSGNAYHFTRVGSAASQPDIISAGLNGLRTLNFDGVEYLSGPAGVATLTRNTGNLWAVAVYKCLSSSAAVRTLLSISTNSSSANRFAFQISRAANTDKPTMAVRRLDADSLASLSATTAISTSWGISMIRMDYTNGDGYIDVNGVLSDASNLALTTSGSTSNTASATTPEIGRSVANTQYGDFEIAALLMGTTIPSNADCDRINGWLAHRYALTSLLDAGHPYKSAPP